MNKTELREKSLKIAHEARDLLNTIKDDNSNSAEVESQFETMMKDSDGLAQRADNLDRVEARDRDLNRIDNVSSDAVSENRDAQSEDETRTAAAFTDYIRGRKTLGELRANGVATDPKGGALVPLTFQNTLLSRLESFGPMLDPSVVNMLVTASGGPIEMPVFNDQVKGQIIGENTLIPEDDLAFDTRNMSAYKYTSRLVRISNELLQDAAVDVDQVVTKALAQRIGRILNEHMTTGTGVGQPQGFVTAAPVGVTTATLAVITPEELIALQHSIDPAYRASAAWQFADATLLKARTMKDTTGAFIWAPGMTVGAPATILGRPYYINPDMAGVYTTGSVVAAFGDFKSYTVRRAKDIYVRRLDERYADYDQVGFVALARFDGALLDTSAVKTLKMK